MRRMYRFSAIVTGRGLKGGDGIPDGKLSSSRPHCMINLYQSSATIESYISIGIISTTKSLYPATIALNIFLRAVQLLALFP